jgi:hypothetical protein
MSTASNYREQFNHLKALNDWSEVEKVFEDLIKKTGLEDSPSDSIGAKIAQQKNDQQNNQNQANPGRKI